MSNAPKIHIIDANKLRLEEHTGMEMPESTPPEFPLIDHDEFLCRTIGKDELQAAYVDTNIASIKPSQPDPWTLHPDSIDLNEVMINYSDGRSVGFPLGSIGFGKAPLARGFRKCKGIIFPVSGDGLVALDATNTPLLSSARREFHQQLATLAAIRLEHAEIVDAFNRILALRSSADLPF